MRKSILIKSIFFLALLQTSVAVHGNADEIRLITGDFAPMASASLPEQGVYVALAKEVFRR